MIFLGKIPIPADTIVGMYHPWRDVVWNNYSTGVPFKNFLITDPVRQQYVWRLLAVEQFKEGKLPFWNPYSFSGAPLLANFQTAAFYPLNLFFSILPFNLAWGLLILLQPLLSGIFLYLYLRFINIERLGSLIGAIAFSFSGFNIAWLEWNTIGHVAAWLPLTLLAIEKVINYLQNSPKRRKSDYRLGIFWLVIFILSLIAAFFAGHLQIFFYGFVLTVAYLFAKIISYKQRKITIFLVFLACFLIFVILASIQWLPTFQYIMLSARSFDQGSWIKTGWFIPWENLIQFIAPDFFGNPATGNYWGIWNYGEFIGYIGIIPLIFALYALVFCHDRKTWFFRIILAVSLVFALPTPIAKLPYQWQVPFISSSQPTRLLVLTDLSLCILAALGIDRINLKINSSKHKKKIFAIIFFLGIVISFAWLLISVILPQDASVSMENLSVAKRNLVLPSLLIFSAFVMFILLSLFGRKKNWIMIAILIITILDLFRFGWKFTPFSQANWIFPNTQITNIIRNDKESYRVMSLDRRVTPPNFLSVYHIQDVAGYDPLYPRNYSKLVASWEKNIPDNSTASFNRIVVPSRYDHVIADLLGVKYFVTIGPIKSKNLDLVYIEGQTYLYENKKRIPRTFFVEQVKWVDREEEALEFLFRDEFVPQKTAVVEKDSSSPIKKYSTFMTVGTAKIIEYTENKIVIQTQNAGEGLLVLTDSYYPTWHVRIKSGNKAYADEGRIFKVDFNFRGVFIPPGENTIEFHNSFF